MVPFATPKYQSETSGLIGATNLDPDYAIANSVYGDVAGDKHFYRTQGSDGNRRTFTWSGCCLPDCLVINIFGGMVVLTPSTYIIVSGSELFFNDTRTNTSVTVPSADYDVAMDSCCCVCRHHEKSVS